MCIVNQRYIDNCGKNLTSAVSLKNKLIQCKSDRKSDRSKDRTIKQLTAANEEKTKRISLLESRWSFLRSFSAGVAAASCTVFALSMVDDASTRVRVVSGTGCVVGGVLVLKW